MKFQRNNIAISLLITWTIIFANCSKSVYVQNDELGTSKYEIYKDNFKYIEKTTHTDFTIWGNYYLTDSTIVFEFKDKNKIPYKYLENNIKKQSKSRNSELLSISVIDKQTKEPVPFASIGAKNDLSKYVGGTETNIKGIAKLKKNEEIKLLQIEFIGYQTQKIDYKLHQNFDLIIEMEELQSGGRMSEGCLITYLDVLLEYRIHRKNDFDKFERNGIVYKKTIRTR